MSKNVPENTFDRLKPYAFLCFAPADRAFAEADAAALAERGYNVCLNAGDRAADTAAVEDGNCRLVLFYLSAAGVTDPGCSVLTAALSTVVARQAHGGRPVPFALVDTAPVGDPLALVQAEEDRLDGTVAATPEAQKQLDDALRAVLRFERLFYDLGPETARVLSRGDRVAELCGALARSGVEPGGHKAADDALKAAYAETSAQVLSIFESFKRSSPGSDPSKKTERSCAEPFPRPAPSERPNPAQKICAGFRAFFVPANKKNTGAALAFLRVLRYNDDV